MKQTIRSSDKELSTEFMRRLDQMQRQSRDALAVSEAELATLGGREPSEPEDDSARTVTTTVLSELLVRERKALEEIAAARARLVAGTFGTCERCGRAIKRSRLEALPTARDCVRCQSQVEGVR